MDTQDNKLKQERLEDKNLKELFDLADEIGKRRYHKLTIQDFEEGTSINCLIENFRSLKP